MNGYEVKTRYQETAARLGGALLPPTSPAPPGAINSVRAQSAIEEIAGRLGNLNESAAVLHQRIDGALCRAAGASGPNATDRDVGDPTPIESGLATIGRRLNELEQRMAMLFSLAERLELIA